TFHDCRARAQVGGPADPWVSAWKASEVNCRRLMVAITSAVDRIRTTRPVSGKAWRRRMALRLVIGNKNYSSWSMRPWIAMKVAGIPFEEEVISLDAADFKARVGRISGTGKVPALADGNVQVWESLAILEYLAERYPDARLWPADP